MTLLSFSLGFMTGLSFCYGRSRSADGGGKIKSDRIANAPKRRKLQSHGENAVHHLIDRRFLRTIAIGGGHSGCASAESIDLMDADRIDFFRRLHHLGNDLRQPVQPVLLQLHADQGVAARVLGVDNGAFALRLRQ